MRTFTWSRLCLWLGVGCCCVQSIHTLGDEKGGGPFQVKRDDLVVLTPVTCKNLTVFPVTSRVAKNQDRFITLDEGLKAGTVKVTEVGARRAPGRSSADRPAGSGAQSRPATGKSRNNPARNAPQEEIEDLFSDQGQRQAGSLAGEVNRVVVSNTSDRPLYLMPGEIIVGGKQDRTLAQEVVVPPGARNVPISVFCVEHGRWAGRAREEAAQVAHGLAGDDLTDLNVNRIAERAKAGEFPQSGVSFGKTGRLAVQEGKGQKEVWDEVAAVNQKSGARTKSGGFTANYVQGELVDRLTPFLTSMEKPVVSTERVVGIIVAVNGKIEAADVFESTPLFRKLWPKLLKSYALDAAGDAQDEQEKRCTVADASKFLSDAMRADVEETKTGKGLVTIRRQAKGIASFSVHEQPMSTTGAGAIGGFGGGIHTSVFAK